MKPSRNSKEPPSKSHEGSLGVKLPTIWTDSKAEVGRVGEEKSRREDQRRERVRRKKMQVRSQLAR